MKIIVGLGNPGPRYKNTRHNVGFMTVDTLAGRIGAAFDKEKHGALIAQAKRAGGTLLLVKPLTFMNNSGDAVAQIIRNKMERLADLLVIVDDVNLPLGKLRLRGSGSAGGHNGLKSIIAQVGSPEFPRLRIGVGGSELGQDLTGHVLGKFAPEELPEVRAMIDRAADAALCCVEAGVERAMNESNWVRPGTQEPERKDQENHETYD